MNERALIEQVAVRHDGNAIMYAMDPCEELCLLAVKEN